MADVLGRDLLNALYRLETQVLLQYSVVQRLANRGARGAQFEQAVQTYTILSRGLHTAEMAAYNRIVEHIRAYPGGESLASQVPRPQPFPSVAGGAVVGAGSGMGGLGIAPVVIGGVAVAPWVLVLLAITAVASLVVVMYFSTEMIATITAQINESARYYQQTLTFEHTFNKCIAAGHSPEQCAEFAQPPAPPRDTRTQGWPWWLTGLAVVGGLVVIGGGIYIIVKAKNRPWGLPAGSYKPVRWSLSGTGGDGDYGLEVED